MNLRAFPIIWAIIELFVFIVVASIIGFGWALLLLIATSVAGLFLVRQIGIEVLQQVSKQAQEGKVMDMFALPKLVFGGFLLIIPGFITDVLGLFLLIPLLFQTKSEQNKDSQSPDQNGHNTIEGECQHKDDE